MSPTPAVREVSSASSISQLSEPTTRGNTGEACGLAENRDGVAVCGKALEDIPGEMVVDKIQAIPVQKEPKLRGGPLR